MTLENWQVRLSNEAEKDFVRILKYTQDTFGDRQAAIYRKTLLLTMMALVKGPNLQGSSSRDEIFLGLRTLHVARQGRRGRHFIMYRSSDQRGIEVVRILHDAMDLARHIPNENGE